VEGVFPIVVITVCIAALVAAFIAFIGSGKLYESIGKGGLTFDSEDAETDRVPAPQSAAARAEAEAEIRQMVEAKSARREARGEAPLDVDAEVAALTRPAETQMDAALRDEVRQLVIASNERRVRRGEDPLDVDAEVARQLRELGST
jgi:valyl-tRNA synthetase